MRRYPKALRKRLEKAARAEAKRIPAVWKAYRKSVPNPSETSPLMALFVALLFFGMLAAGLTLAACEVGPVTVVAAMSALGTGAVFLVAHALRSALYGADDLLVVQTLPLSEPVFFQWQLKKTFRMTVLLMLVFAAGAVALERQLDREWWRAVWAILVGILAWGGAMGLAVWLLSRFPTWPHLRIAVASTCVVATLFLTMGYQSGWDAESPGVWISAVLPSGWPWFGLILGGLRDRPSGYLALAFLALPLAMVLPYAVRRLRAGFVMGEVILGPSHGAEEALEREVEGILDRRAEEAEGAQPVGADEGQVAVADFQRGDPLMREVERQEIWRGHHAWMEERIRSRDFLIPWGGAGADRLTRGVIRFLNERERVLFGYLLPGGTRWTRRWLQSIGLALAAVLTLCLFPSWHWALSVLPLSALLGLPLQGGNWNLLHPATGGMTWPVSAEFPLVFREMAMPMVKANLFRCAAWLSAMLPVMAVLDWRQGSFPFWTSLLLLLGSGSLAVQPFLVASKFASWQLGGSAGGVREYCLKVWVYCTAGLIAGSMLVGTISMLMIQRGGWVWTLLPLFCGGVSLAFFHAYGRYYARGRGDLMRVPA